MSSSSGRITDDEVEQVAGSNAWQERPTQRGTKRERSNENEEEPKTSPKWWENGDAVGEGTYFVTKPLPTKIRCKAYDMPVMFGGEHICTFDPGTYLGPVEAFTSTPDFMTICVRGYWINVWGFGQPYARLVDWTEVEAWRLQGWQECE